MVALAADTPRTYAATNLEHDEKLYADVSAADTIFVGSTLQWDTTNGGVQPYASGTTGFAGFALGGVEIAGTETLGDLSIDVRRKGIVRLVLSATVALTNVGDTVYAAGDDNTFNLTVTSNMPIGKITRVITAGGSGSNLVEVAFEAEGFDSV